MVRRRGVGATVAAAIIFSVILVSNLTLVAAAQGRAELYGAADAETSMRLVGSMLSGVGATDALLSVQKFLAAGPLDCQEAGTALAGAVAGITERKAAGGVRVLVAAYVVSAGRSSDNLTSISPFEGGAPGDLDVALRIAVAGGPQSGVTYRRVETHLAHLPARFRTESSDCRGAAAAFVGAVSLDAPRNCTIQAVAPLMARAAEGPVAKARGDGFAFSYNWSLDPSRGCVIRFHVSLTQHGVQGPAGDFDLAMEETGSATFARPPPSPQG